MANKLPVDPGTAAVAEELNISVYTMALNGGEDYELLFTVSATDYDKLLNIPDVSIIGFMTEKSQGYNLLDDHNHAVPLYAQGWDGFLGRQ
jgi:thiamine-monophosphate kinase